MSKFDLDGIVNSVNKLYKKEDGNAQIALGNKLKSIADGVFLVMPQWWQIATNTKGLPFGGLVMLAGSSDSGKTSCAVAAMKSAQEQGVAVLYVETENKTTVEDLRGWGIDDTQIMLVKTSVAEDAYKGMFALHDAFTEAYPKDKLLVIIDSLGSVVSRHDLEMDMTQSNQKPGGKGKANRQGINSLIARAHKGNTAILILNYTYDNIGSPGKTNAGGQALNFFSSLTYQTTRKQWLEKTIKGQKVRIGARVQWKLFKNHISKANPGPKIIELDITSEGITVAGVTDAED